MLLGIKYTTQSLKTMFVTLLIAKCDLVINVGGSEMKRLAGQEPGEMFYACTRALHRIQEQHIEK